MKVCPDLFVAAIGDEAKSFAQKLIYDLRCIGIGAEMDLLDRSVKAQMKYADKTDAKYSVVLGDDEIESFRATFKNMSTGEAEEVELNAEKIAEYLKRS